MELDAAQNKDRNVNFRPCSFVSHFSASESKYSFRLLISFMLLELANNSSIYVIGMITFSYMTNQKYLYFWDKQIRRIDLMVFLIGNDRLPYKNEQVTLGVALYKAEA